ncbi:MAG: hypothetical protein GXP47_07245 [Acidobacteria bacterium]|nr:hypothetical protein [Acidobacteriota bacterium]
MQHKWIGVCAVALALSVGCGSTRSTAPDDGTRVIRTTCHRVVLSQDAGGKEISAKIVADLRDGSHLDLTTMDKEEFSAIIMKHGHLSVASKVLVGDQEVVCQIEEITNYRELKRLRKNLKSYEKKVRKFVEGKDRSLDLE